MDSATRGKFLIAGAVIGFVGFIIPGLYGVGYNPPAGSAYARISLNQLPGFKSSLSSPNDAVFNGFGGPADFHWAFVALCTMAVLGILAHFMDFEHASKVLTYLHHGLALVSSLVVLGSFIWAFRSNHLPQAVTDLFIKDLGGGEQAKAAAHYLQGQLGFGTLILGFGLLVGLYGVSALVGCGFTILIITLIILIGTGVLR
jgi:hypothetical protein